MKKDVEGKRELQDGKEKEEVEKHVMDKAEARAGGVRKEKSECQQQGDIRERRQKQPDLGDGGREQDASAGGVAER